MLRYCKSYFNVLITQRGNVCKTGKNRIRVVNSELLRVSFIILNTCLVSASVLSGNREGIVALCKDEFCSILVLSAGDKVEFD